MSKKLKLSPWHDGSVKPVHVGVYKVQADMGEYWSWFDGDIFNGCWGYISQAFEMRYFGACSIVIKWRGVLK